MQERTNAASAAAAAIESAHVASDALQHLCRTTLARPSMTPAEVDVVLAHLAAAAAALPQLTRQLGDILDQAEDDYELEMDTLTETKDPDAAIDTARPHLDAIREPALKVYQRIDAAHNETAHISSTDCLGQDAEGVMSRFVRPEHRQPPPGAGGNRPGISR